MIETHTNHRPLSSNRQTPKPVFGGARYAVAPMLDWTDRHCRFFHRILSQRIQLYTEMVTTGAILFGNRERFLDFSAQEQPLAIQIGGSDPTDLAKTAKICQDWGYQEINLNVGCPSDRVQNGRFGACLMREPSLVGECVAAMKAAVNVPVTVKCRIGVDDQDTQEALDALTKALVQVEVDGLVVHARKAWLSGLSPKENRDVPPLDYARVLRLKADHPHLPIMLNGGLATLEAAEEAIKGNGSPDLDGAMIGRAAYQNPEILLGVDALSRNQTEIAPSPIKNGFEAVEAFIPYIQSQLEAGVRLHQMTRHLLGLFPGRHGARLFRRHLATEAAKPGVGIQVLRDAIAFVSSQSNTQTNDTPHLSQAMVD